MQKNPHWKKKNNLKSYCICCFTICFVFVIIFDEHFPGQGSCQDQLLFSEFTLIAGSPPPPPPSRQGGGHFAHSRCPVFEAMGGWLRRGSSLSPSPIKLSHPQDWIWLLSLQSDLQFYSGRRNSDLSWDILAYWLRFKVEWWELP